MSTHDQDNNGSKSERVVAALRDTSVMRSRDLMALGVSREYLRKLRDRGTIERVGRGLYQLPGAEASPRQTMLEACRRVPHGVIALLSALRFHDVTTQAPFEVWMAIDPKARQPRVESLPLRIVRFSGAAFREGIEEHVEDGVTIRVYGLAKTVADCFKYRNKIGLDVALEALREALRSRKVSVDELWHFAAVCRVSKVMRPYLESLS
ncbi:MAG TPA: type IV toxin-antitoxin system AbiEi family antitoxin domain-containing protein [Anaerolineae bacterium]|nr:type IV toxin-antitoxin system AbiEi family antitoxin domain-containing protein [Anaerolineae bacterium]